MREKKEESVGGQLWSRGRFAAAFGFTALLVASSNLLMQAIQKTDSPLWAIAAMETGNILFVSFLIVFTIAYWQRRTVTEPVRSILATVRAVEGGDFTSRVDRSSWEKVAGHLHEFDVLADGVDAMAKELAGTESLRSDFIANVSHEFKNPIAAPSSYAQLLAEDEVSEADRKLYADKMLTVLGNLSELVGNILKINRLENQTIYPAPRTFDLGEELCESFLPFADACEKKGLDVTVEMDDGVLVHSDPDILGMLWSNLFSNAVKFTGEGGKISIGMHEKSEGVVTVTVTDTGCGMDEETKRRVFEKFYQGDPSHATKGNGLGMALAKRAADVTGATIGLESEAGHGTTFTVTLPAASQV
ncbi:MAG: sensor histidine kinase [Atopobiaceae bacterium]